MKIHLNPDKELVTAIREALKANDGFCPCVEDSRGKEEYRCICKDMFENIQPGQTCHCGLYIKDEQ